MSSSHSQADGPSPSPSPASSHGHGFKFGALLGRKRDGEKTSTRGNTSPRSRDGSDWQISSPLPLPSSGHSIGGGSTGGIVQTRSQEASPGGWTKSDVAFQSASTSASPSTNSNPNPSSKVNSPMPYAYLDTPTRPKARVRTEDYVVQGTGVRLGPETDSGSSFDSPTSNRHGSKHPFRGSPSDSRLAQSSAEKSSSRSAPSNNDRAERHVPPSSYPGIDGMSRSSTPSSRSPSRSTSTSSFQSPADLLSHHRGTGGLRSNDEGRPRTDERTISNGLAAVSLGPVVDSRPPVDGPGLTASGSSPAFMNVDANRTSHRRPRRIIENQPTPQPHSHALLGAYTYDADASDTDGYASAETKDLDDGHRDPRSTSIELASPVQKRRVTSSSKVSHQSAIYADGRGTEVSNRGIPVLTQLPSSFDAKLREEGVTPTRQNMEEGDKSPATSLTRTPRAIRAMSVSKAENEDAYQANTSSTAHAADHGPGDSLKGLGLHPAPLRLDTSTLPPSSTRSKTPIATPSSSSTLPAMMTFKRDPRRADRTGASAESSDAEGNESSSSYPTEAVDQSGEDGERRSERTRNGSTAPGVISGVNTPDQVQTARDARQTTGSASKPTGSHGVLSHRDRSRANRDRSKMELDGMPAKISHRSKASHSSRAREGLTLSLPNADVPRAPRSAMYFSRQPQQGKAPEKALRAHTANLVGEKIYVIGGCNKGGCWSGVAVYDTESYAWTIPPTDGDSFVPLRAHTTTLVDGLLYVFGGGDGSYYSNDVWTFDTLRNRWRRCQVSAAASGVPPTRRAHTAVLFGNHIVIFGGGNGQRALNDVWALNVSNPEDLRWEEWDATGDRPVCKGYHTANLVNNKMIIYGGSDGHQSFPDVHVLDLETLIWTHVDTGLQFSRLSHTSTQVGSYLFIFGGHDGTRYPQDLLLFNLVTLSWEKKPVHGKFPTGRGYHTGILHDSRLLLHGGYNGVQHFDEMWALHLSTNAYLPQVTTFEIDETAHRLELHEAV